uniref:Salivary lipocalin n=1 Tax=Ornithodoros parkeri TaxID=140564 RepID=A6N9Q5_ORNPR|nr:salivary lipocalin [Ornithodoros parkeri]
MAELWMNIVAYSMCSSPPQPRDTWKALTSTNQHYLLYASYTESRHRVDPCTHMVNIRNDTDKKMVVFQGVSYNEGSWTVDNKYILTDKPGDDQVKDYMTSAFHPQYRQHGQNYSLVFAKYGKCFILREIYDGQPNNGSTPPLQGCELWVTRDLAETKDLPCATVFKKMCGEQQQQSFNATLCCQRTTGNERPPWCAQKS